MLEVNERIRIPADEFHWTFVRASGPGGQNVNKVASRAVLRWDLAGSPSLPAEVKARFCARQARRINDVGELILNSQRFRDQGRNIDDCLEKLRAMILEALAVPKPRKRTRPSRSSQERRLQDKRRRSATKDNRRRSADD